MTDTDLTKYDWRRQLGDGGSGDKSQWMNGALCKNNASVSYFQNMFSAFGVSPQTSADRVPFLDPL